MDGTLKPHQLTYPTLSPDSDPATEAVQLEIYRQMSASRKISLVFQAIEMNRAAASAGLRQRYSVVSVRSWRAWYTPPSPSCSMVAIPPEGQPYLVMEYVRGVPLDRYCRDQAPSIEAVDSPWIPPNATSLDAALQVGRSFRFAVA